MRWLVSRVLERSERAARLRAAAAAPLAAVWASCHQVAHSKKIIFIFLLFTYKPERLTHHILCTYDYYTHCISKCEFLEHYVLCVCG